MDFRRRYGFYNVLTFTLPLFCLLITWAASTATTSAPGPPYPPPLPSAHAVAEILRSRGYSLIASTLLSTFTSSNNFSGTILAPPDFAFSIAIAKLSPNRRVLQRPSAAVLFYHTLREPLTWHNLSSLVDGNELPTFYNGDCLFVKNSNGDVSVSTSKKPVLTVRIRQPDMYIDDQIVVHGIDGILDPTSASKCSDLKDHTPPAVQSPSVDRKFLDHAVRALRRRGFTVVAAGLSIKRPEILSLDAVSLFAPSDRALFSNPGGFSFDFRRHVLPQRHRLDDLARYPPKITVFQTLAANRTMTVDSVDGAITVNGVRVNSTEVYQNRWIVVFSVSASLDDYTGNLLSSGDAAQLPQPPCGAVEYPAPTHSVYPPTSNEFSEVESPPLPLPLPPPTADGHGSQCRISDFPVEIEGGDLLCPVPARSLLEDGDALTAESAYEDVAQSLPSYEDQLPEDVTQSSIDSGEGDEDKVRAPTLRDQVNIADDLFFYS